MPSILLPGSLGLGKNKNNKTKQFCELVSYLILDRLLTESGRAVSRNLLVLIIIQVGILQDISELQRDHLFGSQSVGLCTQNTRPGFDGVRQVLLKPYLQQLGSTSLTSSC